MYVVNVNFFIRATPKNIMSARKTMAPKIPQNSTLC